MNTWPHLRRGIWMGCRGLAVRGTDSRTEDLARRTQGYSCHAPHLQGGAYHRNGQTTTTAIAASSPEKGLFSVLAPTVKVNVTRRDLLSDDIGSSCIPPAPTMPLRAELLMIHPSVACLSVLLATTCTRLSHGASAKGWMSSSSSIGTSLSWHATWWKR